MQLFYTPDLAGKSYTLDESESKHAIRVLRLAAGDEIILINGKGGLYRAVITDANPKRCSVKVIYSEQEHGKTDFQVHVAIAPTKNIERLEWFLEKATEIGINSITPINCRFSERKEIKHDRLEKVMISAMKQSMKAYLPKLDPLTHFNDFVSQPFNGQKFIAHCSDQFRTSLKELVSPCQNYLILIGPEGDFSNDEIELAVKSGFQPVSLGNSRLRTETAGVVACHTFNLINQ